MVVGFVILQIIMLIHSVQYLTLLRHSIAQTFVEPVFLELYLRVWRVHAVRFAVKFVFQIR